MASNAQKMESILNILNLAVTLSPSVVKLIEHFTQRASGLTPEQADAFAAETSAGFDRIIAKGSK